MFKISIKESAMNNSHFHVHASRLRRQKMCKTRVFVTRYQILRMKSHAKLLQSMTSVDLSAEDDTSSADDCSEFSTMIGNRRISQTSDSNRRSQISESALNDLPLESRSFQKELENSKSDATAAANWNSPSVRTAVLTCRTFRNQWNPFDASHGVDIAQNER
jgi:hypothetical protein